MEQIFKLLSPSPFYLRYPISEMPSHQLTWSHYLELLKLDDDLERGFYEQQAIAERWSVAELKRQKPRPCFYAWPRARTRWASCNWLNRGGW